MLVLETPQSLKDFIGREIAVSDWFSVAQEQIQQFATVTGDEQWIHIDRERASRESPYSGTIAHGFLTLSLLSRFMRQAMEIRSGCRMTVNYGLNRVRFPAPVRADSRVRAHFRVVDVKDISDAVQAVFDVKVECQGAEKPCCAAEWVVRYYA